MSESPEAIAAGLIRIIQEAAEASPEYRAKIEAELAKQQTKED